MDPRTTRRLSSCGPAFESNNRTERMPCMALMARLTCPSKLSRYSTALSAADWIIVRKHVACSSMNSVPEAGQPVKMCLDLQVQYIQVSYRSVYMYTVMVHSSSCLLSSIIFLGQPGLQFFPGLNAQTSLRDIHRDGLNGGFAFEHVVHEHGQILRSILARHSYLGILVRVPEYV